jgi:hypothetical protein
MTRIDFFAASSTVTIGPSPSSGYTESVMGGLRGSVAWHAGGGGGPASFEPPLPVIVTPPAAPAAPPLEPDAPRFAPELAQAATSTATPANIHPRMRRPPRKLVHEDEALPLLRVRAFGHSGDLRPRWSAPISGDIAMTLARAGAAASTPEDRRDRAFE